MKLSRLLLSLASMTLVSTVATQPAVGQCRVNEGAKLTASDAEESDWFGFTVSVSGDVAVVGSWRDDDAGLDSGSAYVYRFDGSSWIEEQKLTASDAGGDDRFGASVSVSGDVVVVAAVLDDPSGSAYVYRFNGNTWIEEQKLTASDEAKGNWFGFSLSVSGEAIVVGARNDDDAGEFSGSAYVYRFDDKAIAWLEEQKLTASDAAPDDRFGGSVSISGDVAVVGASQDNDAGFHSGSAYVYRFDGGGWEVHGRAQGLPSNFAVTVARDPEDRIWVGTWEKGIGVLGDDGVWRRLDQDNSVLRGITQPSNPGFVVISDIQRDAAGLMWIANIQAGLAVMDTYPPRRSHLYGLADLGLPPGTDLSKLAIGPDGLKWVATPKEGFALFDDGGTPFEPGDDVAVVVSTSGEPRLRPKPPGALLPELEGIPAGARPELHLHYRRGLR